MLTSYQQKGLKRFYLEDAMVDISLRELHDSDCKVLLAIARHYNKSGQCWPSIRRIGMLTSLHHETVRKSVNHLQEIGFIEITEIKERTKVRLRFTKSARWLLCFDEKLLENSDTKEEKEIKGADEKTNKPKMTPREAMLTGYVPSKYKELHN